MRGPRGQLGRHADEGVFETSDGALVMVGAFKADPREDIGNAIERPNLAAIRASRPTSGVPPTRRRCMRSHAALHARPHGALIARLEAQDLLCAPVRTLAAPLADGQTAINGMVLEGPGEVVEQHAARARRSTSPPHRSRPACRRALGQHTEEVLAELVPSAPAAAE